MTWVYRNGKMVEKTYDYVSARSSLPCPSVIRDTLSEPLRHMANGRYYDSKRAMEKADREAGCICVGNEMPQEPSGPPPPITRDEVCEAYKMVRDGYKPVADTEPVGGVSGYV
jgi:hypothetical protein